MEKTTKIILLLGIIVAIVLVGVLILALLIGTPGNKFVGTWEDTRYEEKWTFVEDGTAIKEAAGNKPLRYKIEGDLIFIYPAEAEYNYKQDGVYYYGWKYTFYGDDTVVIVSDFHSYLGEYTLHRIK